MTKFIYVVEVRGLVPAHLSRKVTEAHARALKSKALAHPRHGKDVAKSEPELAVLESGGNEDISGEYRL